MKNICYLFNLDYKFLQTPVAYVQITQPKQCRACNLVSKLLWSLIAPKGQFSFLSD